MATTLGLLLELILVCSVLSSDIQTGHNDGCCAGLNCVFYYETLSNDVSQVVRQEGTVHLNFTAFNRTFYSELSPSQDEFLPGARFVYQGQNIQPHLFFKGQLEGDCHSSVKGHIVNGLFDGIILSSGVEYHIETASKFFTTDQNFHSIVYRAQDVDITAGCGVKPEDPDGLSSIQADARFIKEANDKARLRRSTTLIDHKVCPMLIAADHLFLENIGGGNVTASMAEMVSIMSQVQTIFKSTDFDNDGIADGIMPIIAQVEVMGLDTPGYNFLNTSLRVDEYLNLWTQFDHEQYCLALLMTYRDFDNGLLGLAYVVGPPGGNGGGICEKPVTLANGNQSFNTAVVTLLNFGQRLARPATVLSTARMIGFGFGAHHDPDTAECSPGAENGGNYIMNPQRSTLNGILPNNNKFSPCSRQDMLAVLQSSKASCFILPPPPNITSSVPGSLFIANVSEDFTIFFTVISNPPITFQVYRRKDSNSPVEILTGNQIRFHYSLNETQFQLTISDLRKSDAGYYTISARNQIGNFSITVTIQPVESPAITEPPLNQLAERGGNATFTCSATGFPCPTISWEHNMEPVSGNYAVVTDNCTNDTVTSMLTVRNVNSIDSGTFSCIAIVNPGGENNSLSITQTAQLTVGVPDNSVSIVVIVTVTLGVVAALLIVCVVTAFGGMVYSKRKKTAFRKTPNKQSPSNLSPYPTDDMLLQTINKSSTELQDSAKEADFTADIPTTCSQLNGVVPDSLKIPAITLKLASTPIGHGEMGIVYKGKLLQWNNVPLQGVAVKTLKGLFTSSDMDSLMTEIVKMKDFRHPHVMPLIGVCLDAGPGVAMVMPYMANGSVLDYVKKERANISLDVGCDEKQTQAVRKLLVRMCHQVALGMRYLTQQKFIHRDLAARNCMLDQSGNIKVGDFGLAEDIYATGYFRQGDRANVKLPFKWMAIESLNDTIFTEKTDVWSYGVTMWEVFSCGRNPYPAVDPLSLIRLLEEGRRLDMPLNAACSAEIFAVMLKCWLGNPEDRPTFYELASTMEDMLRTVSDYVELEMDLRHENQEYVYDYVVSPSSTKCVPGGFSNPIDTTAAEVDENTAYNAHEGMVVTKNAAYDTMVVTENAAYDTMIVTENAAYDTNKMSTFVPVKETISEAHVTSNTAYGLLD